MQRLVAGIVSLCLIQAAFSACAEGTFANGPVAGASKTIECAQCLPFCKTCNAAGACLTFTDNTFKGLNTATPAGPQCGGLSPGILGYDKNNDACGRCADGCALCIVDYDYCLNCKAGWDWDRSAMKCVRATLGLSAVVLALSVLILIFGVVTCILSCKL